MEEEKKVDVTETSEEQKGSAPSQEKKPTEKEKAEFNLKRKAEEARALGIDPASVLGIKPTMSFDEDLPDDKPLTVRDLREMQKKDAHKTALQLADELPENERDEVKTLLESRIIPSGNADEDLRLARAAVNANHNAQIVKHISQRVTAKVTAAGGSSDAVREEDFVPTPDEAVMMRPPFNLSKEKIIAARNKH